VSSDAPKLAVVMDYQNIHLTAHGLFAPYGTPVHEVLIHPLAFAEQMLQARAERQMDVRQKQAVLTDVFVYRGQPSNSQQAPLYRVTQAQKAEWTRDPRVHVTYRQLKYAPNRPPQEKGVDVLVALNLVRLAEAGLHDVVVLAAHDTDQEPALEMATEKGRAKIETCGWEGERRLRIPGRALWHTSLNASRMVASRDRKDYSRHLV
jgi:uncharacterized LabA/DUF88 family protein